MEEGVGPGVESIGVRCTRWKGKGFLAVSFAFSKENGSCLFGSLSHGGGMGNVASLVLCCVMCALPPFSATCPFFLGVLWSTPLASSARSQPFKLSVTLQSIHLLSLSIFLLINFQRLLICYYN